MKSEESFFKLGMRYAAQLIRENGWNDPDILTNKMEHTLRLAAFIEFKANEEYQFLSGYDPKIHPLERKCNTDQTGAENTKDVSSFPSENDTGRK